MGEVKNYQGFSFSSDIKKRNWKGDYDRESDKKLFSALLLLESVFEEHEDGSLRALVFLVLAHDNHGIGVHGLAGEELEFLEAAWKKTDVIKSCSHEYLDKKHD